MLFHTVLKEGNIVVDAGDWGKKSSIGNYLGNPSDSRWIIDIPEFTIDRRIRGVDGYYNLLTKCLNFEDYQRLFDEGELTSETLIHTAVPRNHSHLPNNFGLTLYLERNWHPIDRERILFKSGSGAPNESEWKVKDVLNQIHWWYIN